MEGTTVEDLTHAEAIMLLRLAVTPLVRTADARLMWAMVGRYRVPVSGWEQGVIAALDRRGLLAYMDSSMTEEVIVTASSAATPLIGRLQSTEVLATPEDEQRPASEVSLPHLMGLLRGTVELIGSLNRMAAVYQGRDATNVRYALSTAGGEVRAALRAARRITGEEGSGCETRRPRRNAPSRNRSGSGRRS